MPTASGFEQILGVRFINATAAEAVECISRKGGYTVVPAAPALANIQRDREYRRALLEADIAIADSGFMVLLWRLLRNRRIARISGLRYLEALLKNPALQRSHGLFLVLPNEGAQEKALFWLRGQGFEIGDPNCYIPPIYDADVREDILLQRIDLHKPGHVVIGIGGGPQEKLGRFLRDHLSYRPAIHCVGAALGFLTGDQKPIPSWADRFYLGWLLRLVRQPNLYAKRFLRAFELPGLILRYGASAPPLLPVQTS